MNKLVTVKPKSKKAKNRFANLMENSGVCIVEQQHSDRLFLRSHKGQNWFWVSLNGDSHWEIES